MPVRSMELATEQLGEHFEALREAVGAANGHLWQTYASDMHRTSSRARANVLCDWIGDEIGQRLSGRSGIYPIRTHGVTSFVVGPNWLLRVHKLDESGASTINDTQLRLELEDNDLSQASLFGVQESATVVYVGYIENVANPLHPEVWLTCPDGEAPAWEILLGTVAPPAPIELPTSPAGPDDETQVVPRENTDAEEK